jgi:hypothetical protein
MIEQDDRPITLRRKGGSAFRQQDLSRAIKAAVRAGVEIARIEIDSRGKIVIVVGKPSEATNPQDELDVELQQWEARRGQG